MSQATNLEIERRFQIKSDIWKNFIHKEIEITQGYWLSQTTSILLKIEKSKAKLHFKTSDGQWFEESVAIKMTDAQELLTCCDTDGFLSTENATIRIRTYGPDVVLTIKKRIDDIACVEIEYNIPFKMGIELLACTDAQVVKTRHLIGIGNNQTAEVDIFRALNAGFSCVEVEFKNHEEAMLFMPPIWFGREIQNNENCSNKALAIKPWLLR